MEVSEPERHRKYMSSKIFHAIFVTILIIFFFKTALLTTRYGMRSVSIKCERDYNHTNTTSTILNHEFIFTTIIYGILNCLRILEYLLLYKQFYHFIFKQKAVNVKDFFKKPSIKFPYLLLLTASLLPYFLLGFAIPGLGIYQEMEHAERVAECYHHYQEVYIAYCAINFFRYMLAFAVRILMIHTAVSLNEIWSPEAQQSVEYTVSKSNVTFRQQNSQRSYGSTEESSPLIDDVSQNGATPSTNFEENNSESTTTQSVPGDWKAVSIDFQERLNEYIHISKQVQAIQDLFQTWFIIPWIVYLIASSLKTYNILRPWNDGDGDTTPSDIPHIYYLLYNINQLITLFVPFLCAKKMNTYHKIYLKSMRKKQLMKFKRNPSRFSFARQLMVEKDTFNDFVPRIVGTSITIPIGSLLFVITLLVGTFLSVSESLLK